MLLQLLLIRVLLMILAWLQQPAVCTLYLFSGRWFTACDKFCSTTILLSSSDTKAMTANLLHQLTSMKADFETERARRHDLTKTLRSRSMEKQNLAAELRVRNADVIEIRRLIDRLLNDLLNSIMFHFLTINLKFVYSQRHVIIQWFLQILE